MLKRILFIIVLSLITVGLYAEISVYPVYSDSGDFVISADGEHFLLAFKSDTNYYVQIDETLLGPFVSKSKPYIYIENNFMAVRYQNLKKLHYFLTADTAYGPFTDLFNFYNVGVCEDGSRYGFAYASGSKYFIQTESELFGPYDGAGNYSCVYSADGNTLGLEYELLNKTYLEINGSIHGPYNEVWRLHFDEDGSRYGAAFISNKLLYGLVDDQLYGPYYDTNEIYYLFSPDGKRAARQYLDNEGWWVFAGTNHYGPHGSVWNLRYNADSSRFGFMYVLFNKYYVVIDGDKQGPYDAAVGFDFSPNGSRYAYAYSKSGDWYVRVDNIIYGPFDGIPVNRFASYPHLFLSQFESGRGIYAFSSDDRRFGFSYIFDDETYIQIDETLYGPFDTANFTFDDQDKVKIGYIKDGYAIIGHLQ